MEVRSEPQVKQSDLDSFKRHRFQTHDLAFFIRRQVPDLIQRVVHIRVVIRVGQGAPVRKEHVHDGHRFAHGFCIVHVVIDPFFHHDEVFFVVIGRIVRIVWIVRIGFMPILASDPRPHKPLRVSERPSGIRAIRFAEFVAAGAVHPDGAPARLRAFIFQAESPNGGQCFVNRLTKIRDARGAEPVPPIVMFGGFAVNVVCGGLHIAAQVALAPRDEAHLHRRG